MVFKSKLYNIIGGAANDELIASEEAPICMAARNIGDGGLTCPKQDIAEVGLYKRNKGKIFKTCFL